MAGYKISCQPSRMPQCGWDLREQIRDILGYTQDRSTQWIRHILNRLYPSDRNRRKAYSGAQPLVHFVHDGWQLMSGVGYSMYIPVGLPCNACEPRFGTIMGMNPDGSELEIYASGIRNTVGFDWNPETGDLWFTDNSHDDLGDDFPPDELNRITEMGEHLGFPYCIGTGVAASDFDTRDCATSTSPMQELGSHVASLGMRFYTGEMFPADYQNQVFIAEHGSWASSTRVGYRVTLVRLDEDGNAVSYEPFANWLSEDGTVLGRPADIEQMPDGSLLVSDDQGGVIYRISYVGEGTEETATEEPES